MLKAAVLDSDSQTATFLRGELGRRRVHLKGLPDVAASDRSKEEEIQVVVPKADPNNPDLIGNMSYETADQRAPCKRPETRNEAGLSSPEGRAAPATPTPTARCPKGLTSWTSASATARLSWSNPS